MFSLVVFCIIIAGPVHICHGLAVPKELFPCKPQAVKFNVSLRSSDTLVVLANSSYCKSPFQPFSVSSKTMPADWDASHAITMYA